MKSFFVFYYSRIVTTNYIFITVGKTIHINQNRLAIKCVTVFLLATSYAFSQVKDTVALNEVVVSGIKAEKFKAGRKIQRTDSIAKQFFNNSNLADLLAFTTPVFVKNYGPQNLSTSSFRGGNASQTAILWNGFNIQNPMLGQNDLSQLPNFIFDDIDVEYGGSSALWGSGAVGGSIQLNNRSKFNRGFGTLLNLGIGSYGTKKVNTAIHYSNAKFSSTTKVYYNTSQNNFNYLDTIQKTQRHNNYEIKGFLQEISMAPFKDQKINIRAWYNLSERNFAPTLGSSQSRSSQKDENVKLTADWSYMGKKIIPAFRVAYFDDVLNYTDSVAKLFSNNRTKTLITEGDVYYKINEQHKLYVGVNSTNYKAVTTNYIQNDLQLSKTAFLLGYSLNLLGNKLYFDISLRQEISSAYTIPLTGGTGISYQVFKWLKLKANAAKVYRLPTLNDLYWKNGGNPNLKPEDGITFEGGMEFKKQKGNYIFQSELTYFNKHINNWINWVPGPNGNATPMNVLKVYSRGTETSNSITYLQKYFMCKMGVNTAYVLSTSLQSLLPNDAAVAKQLIYTPRYNYGANLTLSYYDFSFMYVHNYIGYRFTASDNSQWLKPYQIANLKFGYRYKMESIVLITSIHINNLYNTNYKVMEQCPMPLRNYEISLTLTYNKKQRA